MCGIAGILFGVQPEQPRSIGERMIRALEHRGPDAHGIAALPGGRGVFAHTRLKIIDLSENAAQPFRSEDGRVLLTFNGEIYNYKELRRALEREGVRFRSSSDTEVILEQYRSHGVDGLDALDGMFAFALWDEGKRELVLMRDRLGKKPLYHATTPDGAFVFGSEIKALAAHEALILEMDRERLPEYLTYGYVSTPRSLYRGVHKLPPGCRLRLTFGGTPRIERYWALEERVRAPTWVAIPEARRMVREAIGRAVERRMVADVPLGAFLSGGIDSSIVVAEMAKRSGTRVRTFAVGFEEDPSFDERRYAREVATRFDTDHTEIVVRCSPEPLLGRLLEHHDEPYGDSSALAVFAIAEATRRHVTVVLTGDGGDELFAGYTRFRGGLLAGVTPAGVSKLARAALGRLPEPRGYKHPLALLRRFVEHGDRGSDEQLLAWNSYFSGPRLGALLRRDVFGDDFDPWSVFREQALLLSTARAQGHDRLDQILRHNLATYLVDDLLVKTDRMTMAVALEARCPFLDTELVELAFRLPSAIKMAFGQLKWLLRSAYRDVLPSSILDRKKHGFGVPVSRWWSGELAPMVDDLLLAPTARSAEYLERRELARVVEEHRAGRRDHGQRIFALLQLELWLRGLERARARYATCA